MSFMVETSARHIHLTQETVEKLFGEGYQLTKRGLAGQALGCSFGSSLMGTVLGGLMGLIFAPVLGHYALSFGPPEMFMLALFGMTAVASLTGSSVSRGLLAAILGLLVGTVGLDYFLGVTRCTFGVPQAAQKNFVSASIMSR